VLHIDSAHIVATTTKLRKLLRSEESRALYTSLIGYLVRQQLGKIRDYSAYARKSITDYLAEKAISAEDFYGDDVRLLRPSSASYESELSKPIRCMQTGPIEIWWRDGCGWLLQVPVKQISGPCVANEGPLSNRFAAGSSRIGRLHFDVPRHWDALHPRNLVPDSALTWWCVADLIGLVELPARYRTRVLTDWPSAT